MKKQTNLISRNLINLNYNILARTVAWNLDISIPLKVTSRIAKKISIWVYKVAKKYTCTEKEMDGELQYKTRVKRENLNLKTDSSYHKFEIDKEKSPVVISKIWKLWKLKPVWRKLRIQSREEGQKSSNVFKKLSKKTSLLPERYLKTKH